MIALGTAADRADDEPRLLAASEIFNVLVNAGEDRGPDLQVEWMRRIDRIGGNSPGLLPPPDPTDCGVEPLHVRSVMKRLIQSWTASTGSSPFHGAFQLKPRQAVSR